jgi:hypothetical protein
VRPRSRPKTVGPYCRANSFFETKTVLCDYIIPQIASLKQQGATKIASKNCATILSH